MFFILTFLLSIIFTEFTGYFLHKLLHSDRIRWLSKAHMTHHLLDYGPKMKLREQKYRSGALARQNVAGLGLEWLIPASIIAVLIVCTLSLLNVGQPYQATFVITSTIWSYLMFSYLHDSMHLNSFWMLRVPILNKYFKRARRLHDIHHIKINDEGLMHTNFGICFFTFDRIFGTLCKKPMEFNEKGFEQSLKRYGFVFDAKRKETKEKATNW